MMSGTSLGFIPGGSANGLVRAVLDYSNEEFSVQNAAFVVAKGRTTRMDLTEIDAEYQKDKIYSFLSTFWGVLADCDINSEVIRWVGTSRFTLWGILRVFCIRQYLGSVYYTGQQIINKRDAAQLDEHLFSADLPEINEEPVRHEEDPSQYKDQAFTHVLI